MTFAKSHGVIWPWMDFCQRYALSGDLQAGKKTNIEAVRFGLRNDNVHVEHANTFK